MNRVTTDLIKASAVRKMVRQAGKRCGSDFLIALDAHVSLLVARAAAVHNGGKKTLDATVAGYCGIGARKETT